MALDYLTWIRVRRQILRVNARQIHRKTAPESFRLETALAFQKPDTVDFVCSAQSEIQFLKLY